MTPTRPDLRHDRLAQDDARLRIASVLAELVFDHSLPFIDEQSVRELKEMAADLVAEAVEDFAPYVTTEPDCMDAFKVDAEQ